MTSGPRKLTLFTLLWPILGEQVLHVAVQTVDTFMVSHVSDDAVGALGMSGSVVWVAITFFFFIGIGASIVITHHLGAKDRAGADRIAVAAISANTWIGLVVSLSLFLLARPLLELLHMPAQQIPLAMRFLPLMGGTLFLEAQNIAMGAVLRAHGHTKDPMWVTAVQNGLNVIGNCLLLFGLLGFPKLGVTGVAISGVVSRIISFAIFWVLVKRRTQIRLRARDYFRLPVREIARVLRIGGPSAGENLLWNVAFLTVQSFVARMGATPLNTQSYVMQLSMWIIQFGISVGIANEILVGHHVGAGRFQEAYREALRSLRVAFLMVCAVVVPVAIFAPFLLRPFTQDPEIIRMGAFLLRLGLVLETGRVFNIVLVMSLRATGDSLFPFFMGIASMWCVWVPLAWLLGLRLELALPGVWISMMTDEWTRAGVFYRRWKKRTWLTHAQRSRADAKESISELAAVKP
jgi:putative MATE family efflux protein